MESKPKYLTDDEIAELAKTIRIADPTKDDGAFNSVSRMDALVWLRLMGVKGLDPRSPLSEAEAIERLRIALWDSQRLDYLFSGFTLSTSLKKLKISSFKSWDGWENAHPELRKYAIGLLKLDGYKDAKRLNSYVFRHFNMSVWSQIELQNGENMNPARDMSGAWTGARIIMNNAAMDITREGGKDIPFVTYFDNGNERLLVMEILDVKACPWPEPGKKLMELIKTCQETKFGHPASGPLVPMMQTPTFPLVIVRYSYMEGRPEGGSQFLSHLQDKLAKMMPKNTTVKKVREKLQWHLTSGEEMAAAHLQMLARILSFNAEFVDKDYVDEIQSHWNGISKDVASESKVSFFVPCLRLRFRALEQIETGITPNPERICAACEKSTESKLMCGSCTSVYYCSAACNKANWPEHKSICKFSKNLFKNPPTNLKPGKFYVPARTFLDFIIDNGFAVDQEGVKMSGLAPIGDCPPNEYGDERFILKATRPLDYTVNGMAKGLTIILFDRRRSIQMRTGPGDVMFAEKTKLASGPIPFDVQGHQNLVKLMIEKGLYGQLIFLWAKRIGDCVELDLEDLPNQKVDF